MLPEDRICNYSFLACGYESRYLSKIEELLDPRSSSKTIILGITPHSLVNRSLVGSGFLERLDRNYVDLLADARLGEVLFWFRPYSLEEIYYAVTDNIEDGYFQTHHPDGWIASRKWPENPLEGLHYYQRRYGDSRIANATVENLYRWVTRWSDQGYHVYGFRPPTNQEMEDLENQLSGFNESSFSEGFENAGGAWLSFPAGEYASYDGSHLREDGSVLFSKDLATKIRNHQR